MKYLNNLKHIETLKISILCISKLEMTLQLEFLKLLKNILIFPDLKIFINK